MVTRSLCNGVRLWLQGLFSMGTNNSFACLLFFVTVVSLIQIAVSRRTENQGYSGDSTEGVYVQNVRTGRILQNKIEQKLNITNYTDLPEGSIVFDCNNCGNEVDFGPNIKMISKGRYQLIKPLQPNESEIAIYLNDEDLDLVVTDYKPLDPP